MTALAEARAGDFADPAAYAAWCAGQLERGNAVVFPASSFSLSPDDRRFLLEQRQTSAAYHKNIAYRPLSGRLTGYESAQPDDAARLGGILKQFSADAKRFVNETLAPYAGAIRMDFSSFRPIEEQGRALRLRARNDLLHTDAFPTRPTNGDRILRFFVNLNPAVPRIWITSETFEPLVERLGPAAGLGGITRLARNGVARATRDLGRSLGLTVRSPYDRFMMHFHNGLKENSEFQKNCPKSRWEFPPNAVWMVYTDMVTHAVLSGQFAIEQTFLVSLRAMLEPERSPAGVLQRLCGRPVID
ncbi:MAG TPA: Kdo hydroxylase family protein [Candidatus Dormibacteraeota bacterium]|nr:Kdo hydroxylase family protein [Candidatus Dormibacteraeota bacterium]